MRVRVVIAIHEKEGLLSLTDGKCTLLSVCIPTTLCVACLPHIPNQMALLDSVTRLETSIRRANADPTPLLLRRSLSLPLIAATTGVCPLISIPAGSGEESINEGWT